MKQENPQKTPKLDEVLAGRLAERRLQPNFAPEPASLPVQEESATDLPRAMSSLEEEKTKYASIYDQLYPYIHDGTMPFEKISQETGLKERRIREALLFRLGSGEITQLFGRKIGFCYVCKMRMTNRKNDEPVCTVCLTSIRDTLENAFAIQKAETKEPTSLTESPGESDEPISTSLPPEQYNALLNELNFHRNKVIELSKQLNQPLPEIFLASQPAEATALRTATGCPEPLGTSGMAYQKAEAFSPPEVKTTDDVLSVLEMSENDIAMYIDTDSEDLLDMITNEPLRQYGFQRIKKAAQRKGA